MAYIPKFEDLPKQGYVPNINDLPKENVNDFNPSFWEQLAPNILAGTAQFGHSLLNAPHNIVNAISPEMASHIPKQQEYDYAKMLGLSDTLSNKIVQGVTEAVPSMIMPGARLGKAGELIGKIPAAGKYLSEATGRLLPQIGLGAATNENPLEGASESAKMQAIGELLPGGLKAVGKTAEFFNPVKFAKSLSSKMAADYARAKQKASGYYKAVTDKLGNENIYPQQNQLLLGQGTTTPTSNYISLPQDVIDKYFSPKVKKLHEDFLQDTNLMNAHRLQKQLGSEASRFGRMKHDPLAGTIADSMSYARDILDKDIKSFINIKDPNLAKKWQKGIDVFREEAAPYRTSTPVLNMAMGNKKTVTPKQAINALTKVTEIQNPRKLVPEGHLLRNLLDEMQNKYYRGQAAYQLIPGKSILHQFPDIMSFAQNPAVEKGAAGLYPFYEQLKNGIIAAKLNEMNKNR